MLSESNLTDGSDANTSSLLSKIMNGVGHDLKSPLSALTLCMDLTEMLMNEAKTLDQDCCSTIEQRKETGLRFMIELQKTLDVMEATRKNMHMIINRCVDFSKAASGIPLVPTIAPVQVRSAVESIVESCRAQTDNGQPVIKVTWDSSVPKDLVMQTDGLWFEESLQGLINNAVKFSPSSSSAKGSPHEKQKSPPEDGSNRANKNSNSSSTIEVQLSVVKKQQTHERFLRAVIKDRGLGIPKDRRATIFSYSNIVEMTQSIPMAQQSGGAGIGLYTLACRCAALRGSVNYSPNVELLVTARFGEERGSIFAFELPLSSSDSSHPLPPTSTLLLSQPASERSIARVDSGRQPNSSPNRSGRGSSFVRGVSTACTPRNKLSPGYLLQKQAQQQKTLSQCLSAADGSPPISDIGPGLLPIAALALDRPSSSNNKEKYGMFPALTLSINTNSSKTLLNVQRPLSATAGAGVTLPAIQSGRSDTSSLGDIMMISRKTMIAADISPLRYSDRPLGLLIVDDSSTIRKMAAMVLSKAGHQVTVAAHGQEAVRLLLPETAMIEDGEDNEASSSLRAEKKQSSSTLPFDVVLMDIQMPVMDGLTATSIYRQAEAIAIASQLTNETSISYNDSNRRRLLIIGMSACSDDSITAQAHDAGMDFFMPKPFSIHHFLAILQEVDDHEEQLLC